jgi:hypothetical protein
MLAGEAARALGIRTETLARWRKAGRITGTRMGNGHFEYARAEVERVLDGLPRLAPRAKDVGEPPCPARFSGPEPYMCTVAEGHQGDHVAHGMSGRVITTWPAEQVPR